MNPYLNTILMYKLAFVLKVAELNNKMLHHRYLVDNPESSMQDLKFKKTCRKKGAAI